MMSSLVLNKISAPFLHRNNGFTTKILNPIIATTTSSCNQLFHHRSFSSNNSYGNYDNSNGYKNASPSYQIYGETAALTLKMIPPSFKQVGKNTMVVDAKQKGRLLLEFTPRNMSAEHSRYNWDSSVKFAITAEEVGLLLGRSQTLEPIDMSRHNTSNTSLPSKVLRVQEFPDGSALFLVDYYKDGFGGQEPPNPNEAQGPIEVSLMVGEYQVVRSIFQYSMPRLIGWSTMMDVTMDNAFNNTTRGQQTSHYSLQNPHNYTNAQGRADDVPF